MPIRLIALFAVIGLAAVLSSRPAPREQAGPIDGGYLLVSGWKSRPAGKQVPLDTFPMSCALSKDGKHLLVLNAGYKPPSISVLDVASMKETSRVPVKDGWLGLTFHPGGDRVYAGGGSSGSVFEFSFEDGKLEPARVLQLSSEARAFIGDVAIAPGGNVLYATNLYHDSVVRVDLASGSAPSHIETGRRPYRIIFHPEGESFFVSNWADNTVVEHEAATGRVRSRLDAGAHPSAMAWKDGRLFVAAANTNKVYVLSREGEEWKPSEQINISLTPRQPVGMTPSALAFNHDLTRLFVVCSDGNSVAVVDTSKPAARVLGFLPAGWYPTEATVLPDGTLVVLNGRGQRSYPNPLGPSPVRRAVPQSQGTGEVEYVGRIQIGSASFIPPFGDRELASYTKAVLENSPYRDSKLDDAGTGRNNPIPSRPGGKTPIEHVVYIIKENRTYDQVLGALGKGNGDPSLVLFGEDITPNQHKLAREFVLLDNFYVSADVSADGHNWSMAAIAPDFTQRVWPNGYGRRGTHRYLFGQEPAAATPNGYLWTHVHEKGLSIRNYGYLGVHKNPAPADGVQIADVLDSILKPVTCLEYRAYELDYPDIGRARAFLRDLAQHEEKGEWARFVLVRLGNNHTQGTTPGRLTPASHVADNDLALGMIVEGITKSRFWPKTAIFVLEDDAQNGPDHVDSHRSPAFVISPYVRRGAIDSTMYNTTSMLRTMELLLGVGPMTHFDAGAHPMSAAFQRKPDFKPYQAVPARVPLNDRNPANSPTAARSLALDFSEADLIDDDELNEILWLAMRGTQPPAPVRSYFSR
ncbi:MAG TPA: alkaline phosphatase family protein [Bryobacteraceae bacterium]|nr:alkaline phosphatase family protein [Bryobacteraceae bacterium]